MDDDKQQPQQGDDGAQGAAPSDDSAGGGSADDAKGDSGVVEEAIQATVDATREAMNKITEVTEDALEGTVQATREAVNTLTEVASIDVNEVVSGSGNTAPSNDGEGADGGAQTGTGDEEEKEGA